MRVEYSKPFRKKFRQMPPKIQTAFAERGRMFIGNPFHPLLSNHKLSGIYEGCRSINITGDWRAIFKEYDSYRLVIFQTLGTHSQLYKK